MKSKNELVNKTTALTFGADPEFFIEDVSSGDVVSAIDVLKVDKYDPIRLDEHTNLYYDNTMGEFTVRPATSKEDFIKSIGSSLSLINDYLIKESEGRFKIKIKASHEFDPRFMEHPEANKIGCNPEYDAWDVCQIIPPDFSGARRSAGGHFAIARADQDRKKSLPLNDFDSVITLVKLLDYFVAVPFVLVDNDTTSLQRKTLYGRNLGAHRPKPEYPGLEYRLLSNYWISSPKLVALIYDLATEAVNRYFNDDYKSIFKIKKEMARSAVIENNKGLAEEIVAALNLPKHLTIRLNQLRDVKDLDVYSEWGLANSSKHLVS